MNRLRGEAAQQHERVTGTPDGGSHDLRPCRAFASNPYRRCRNGPQRGGQRPWRVRREHGVVASDRGSGRSHCCTYQTFSDVRVEVRSIDVPFSGLTLMILNVRGWPYSARNRVFGAHAHTKPCAVDPAASGPHHANPASDATKAIAAREVWLDINIDSQGRGTSLALFDWRIRKGDAGSVVIHAEPTNSTTGAAGARILCTTIALGS